MQFASLLLALAWAALQGEFSLGNLVTGYVAGYVILAMLARGGVGPSRTDHNACAIDLDGDAGSGDGEVAVTSRQFLHREAASACPHGESDAGEYLVVVQCGRPRAGEELGGRDHAAPTR